MKPIYLDINNFGPHEHSVIDFRKLDESPIFLISGDTGAGKSTIFDAMTFALFSTTTGDRDAKEMRSQFAEPNQATKVIFYFEQSGKIYKIERTPEQYLAKKNGQGMTKKTPTANLSVVEDVNGLEIESIATKPVDVGNAITEILNLTSDQFQKIILLPQNDFSEFLKSHTSDKETILKKIFGTQLFTDFTSKLKDHYDQAKTKADDFNNALKTQTQAQVWTTEEQTNLKQTPNDQLVVVLKDYLKIRQDKLNSAKKADQTLNQAWEKADKDYHAAQEIQKNFDNLATYKKEYQTNIVDKSDVIKQYQHHIAELNWAKPLRETVRDLDKATLEQAETTKNVKKLTEAVHNSEIKLNQAKATLADLTAQKDNFQAKHDQAQKLTVLITKTQDIEKIKIEIANLEPQLKAAKAEVAQQTATLEQLQQTIADKKQTVTSTDKLLEQKDDLTKEKDNLIETLSPLKNDRNNLVSEVQKLQKKLDQATEDLKTKQATLTVAKNDYQEKIKTRQSLMIAQLRQELQTGEPCPVCGATDHPFADHTAVADENELRKSMQAVDDSQKKYAAADNDVQTIQNNLDELSAEFAQKQTKAVTALRTLSAKYTELMDQSKLDLPQEFDLNAIKKTFQVKIEDIDVAIRAAQKIANEIKELENQQTESQTDLSQANSKLDKLSAQFQTRSTDYQAKLHDLDNPEISSQELVQQQTQLNHDYDTFQKQLTTAQENVTTAEKTFSNNQTRLTDIQATLEKQTATIKELSDTLTQSLNSTDAKTNDYDTLDHWIHELAQDELSQLQNKITSYNKEKEMLDESILKIQKQLTDVTKPDLVTLKQVAADLQTKHELAIAESATANKEYNNAQKNLVKVQKIMQQQGDFAKELAAITSLYNVVTGKDGNDSKLKLETYVVQNYLQKILHYANITFMNHLSNNRYSFVISQNDANKQRDHGLDINISDRQTGKIRSSNTLSGGETFIAALSIALSLSEVVQSSANGVQIDALFVDEGFGSLDDDTLNDAMDALEEIGKNRMVGVISHVDSMQQRIAQQLLIKKLGDGKSKIELITK